MERTGAGAGGGEGKKGEGEGGRCGHDHQHHQHEKKGEGCRDEGGAGGKHHGHGLGCQHQRQGSGHGHGGHGGHGHDHHGHGHKHEHGKDYFNHSAATYDNKPFIQEFADDITATLLLHLQTSSTSPSPSPSSSSSSSLASLAGSEEAERGDEWKNTLDVLDFGCGTGLLSTRLAPLVRRVDAVDVSEGMLAQLNRKIAADSKLRNIHPHQIMLESTEQLDGRRFGLVITSMALHHVSDVDAVLPVLAGFLAPGGTLAVFEFLKGESTAHIHGEKFSQKAGVYHRGGFTGERITELLTQAGLTQIKFVPDAIRMKSFKKNDDGEAIEPAEVVEYEILACFGVKPK